MAASSFADQWANYEFPPSFVLGFHGCDAKVGEAILRGNKPHLTPSENEYDWLGHGIYAKFPRMPRPLAVGMNGLTL